MTVYTCIHDWDAMLTCIYEASKSGKGHKNIRFEIEPVEQYTLFDEYIHVDTDFTKASKVADMIIRQISPNVYHELAFESMAYERDVLDNIYRVLLLGFNYGPGVLNMVQFRDVMRNAQIRKRVGNEAHSFREFIRFHEIPGGVYVAHIEPKSKLVAALGMPFSDRMPSEHWMIIDDIHREAVVHPKNEHYYIRRLSDEEFERLLLTEKENDGYTDLWQVFFDAIAIKQRINPTCQMSHFPVWQRKHAVEFI